MIFFIREGADKASVASYIRGSVHIWISIANVPSIHLLQSSMDAVLEAAAVPKQGNSFIIFNNIVLVICAWHRS